MADIHVYKDNPTAGGVDGTLVSEGTGAAPITVGPLNATINEESAAQKLAIRCDAGYVTTGNTTITPNGASATKWALSLDGSSWGVYGAALTISSVINATNTIFYAKAKATTDEVNPVNDSLVDLVVNATIAAA